ncbi:thiol-disulfide oxidoreductase [Virgibacillus phasianinus]|uniref:Thiol-disulfide oxidoreductase n=1 Tax=Virgibacillus phasianinus TaxID=2017483 RepID=A0A220TZU6_9BACI|nr:thiol-disulfide oxidoreductase ResA [Virgibacillus phasianinus]ASK61310.1 thiol-disulfide oxidoreductase [Virgibacillus phasianinus]
MNLEQVKANKHRKKRNRLIFRITVLVILLAAVGYALVSNLTKDTTKIDVGSQAPDFVLEQVNKNNELESVRLSDLEGKGVMLNFWATYCKPCEAEMPYMQKLYPEYKEKGIEIVAVSLDATELVIDRFIDKYDLTFPIPHDKSGQVMDLYGVGPIPSTFFISPKGKVVKIVAGALTLDSLEGYLKQIQPE